MTPFFCRCLLALGGMCIWSVSAAPAELSWEAVFRGPESEPDSVAFPVGDGRYFVAVALSGVQIADVRLRSAGRILPAEVFVDPVSRVVIFRISGPAEKALPLASSRSAAAGAEWAVKGGGKAEAEGWIKQINGKMLPLSLLKMDYSATVPRAGTPLTDASGAVVAIAHQASDGRRGYALPVEVVKRVLEDVQGHGKVSRGWIGLKLRPEAKVPQVTKVQEGSPSALAGVREGDVLLQIGQLRTPEYADAVNAFFFLRPGVSAPLRLRRGNQELSLSVTPVRKEGN